MKYIYFGSSQFSKDILEGLADKNSKPSAVVSKPAMPKGRGLKIVPTLVSYFAKKNKIKVFTPNDLSDPGLYDQIKKIAAELFIVADYGKIIPPGLLSLPKLFSICVHPSLLPLYRGASPIEQALLDGQEKTGVTIFKMNEKVDAGEIIYQKELKIKPDDDYITLRQRLVKQGINTLIKSIDLIGNNKYELKPQNPAKATFSNRLTKATGEIDWHRSAESIRNLIRATVRWPGAYTFYKNILIKIIKAELVFDAAFEEPGVISEINKSGIVVVAGNNALKITELKPQGKRQMDAWSFACGYRLKVGEKLTKQN